MMMGFGFLFVLVLLAILIGLAVWVVSYLFPGVSERLTPRHPTVPDSPLDILDRRYARGEISKSEYDEVRQSLIRGQGSQ